MFGLDDKIAALGTGESFLIIIAVAVLLGVRHATDPDHLITVSTLLASEHSRGAGGASLLGFSWGLGHATTLFLFGLPIVLFDRYLPNALQQAAEVAVGVVIMALAVRLLLRWSAHGRSGHGHSHRGKLGRSPLQAFGVGLLHGVGGSAGVGVLLLAAIPSHVEAAIALVVFAAFTAISMALASTSFGYALARGPILARVTVVAPALATMSLAFGTWYALGALQAMPTL
jgi:hypothetical protein